MTRPANSVLQVTIIGPKVGAGRIGLLELITLGRSIQSAVQRIAFVLSGKGPSVRRGRPPADIADLTRLDLVGFKSGSAVLEFDFAEGERPFAEWDVGEVAIDRLVQGLSAVENQTELPMGWDIGVLATWQDIGSILDRGVDRLVLERSKDHVHQRAEFTRKTYRAVVDRIRRPTEASMTVEGRLLMADFDETRRRCRIHPVFGAPVVCMFEGEQRDTVLALLTRYVRVSGQAIVDEELDRVKVLKIGKIESIETLESEGYEFWHHYGIAELAKIQNVPPVENVQALTASLWESEEDLDSFLTDIYRSRELSVG